MKKKHRSTIGNKIVALFLIAISFTVAVIDGDGTALILMLIIGIPLFFSKKNLIYTSRD